MMIFRFFQNIIFVQSKLQLLLHYTEGRCEDPVRVNEDPRAHVFEGIGNSPDGYYVRELSLAGVLSPMDPGPRNWASKCSVKSEDQTQNLYI